MYNFDSDLESKNLLRKATDRADSFQQAASQASYLRNAAGQANSLQKTILQASSFQSAVARANPAWMAVDPMNSYRKAVQFQSERLANVQGSLASVCEPRIDQANKLQSTRAATKFHAPAIGLAERNLFSTPSLKRFQMWTPDKALESIDPLRKVADHLYRSQEAVDQIATLCEATHGLYPDRQILPDLTRDYRLDIARMLPPVPSVDTLDLLPTELANIQDSLAGICDTWIDQQSSTQSIRAAFELHVLSVGLTERHPFSTELTELLRTNLGDWRRIRTTPAKVQIDPVVRSSYYRERGLDASLTDFPSLTFNELLDRSGLRAPTWPDPAPVYGPDSLILPNHPEEEVPETNREAYDIIFRLETRLRQFIDAKMIAEFGIDWPITQSDGLYTRWTNKRLRAMSTGQPSHPLIFYADFSDYIKIIEYNDNWDRVFKKFFRCRASVRESLARLNPVRNSVMHCREITSDDRLYLFIETPRIFAALEIVGISKAAQRSRRPFGF